MNNGILMFLKSEFSLEEHFAQSDMNIYLDTETRVGAGNLLLPSSTRLCVFNVNAF